jgi:L-asparagine transporter-like permease
MITRRIPLKGLTGLLFVVAVLGILLVAVPATRWFLLLSVLAGALVAVILYLLRSRDR